MALTAKLSRHTEDPTQPSLAKTIQDQDTLIKTMTEAGNSIRKFLDGDDKGDSWLIRTLKWICTQETPPMAVHGLQFECIRRAAKSNAKLLKKFKYNLAHVIDHFPNSTISLGSEFRSTPILHKLFERHEDWNIASAILEDGARYPFRDGALDNVELRKELKGMETTNRLRPQTTWHSSLKQQRRKSKGIG